MEEKKDTDVSVTMEMSDIRENILTNYKMPLTSVNVSTLISIASTFHIKFAKEWAENVWNNGQLQIIDKNDNKQMKSLKEVSEYQFADMTCKILLPVMNIIVTNGTSNSTITAPLSVNLGIVHKYLKQNDSTQYCLPPTPGTDYVVVPYTAILFDLCKSNGITLFLKPQIQSTITGTINNHFSIMEETIIKKIGTILSINETLTKLLPKSLKVNDNIHTGLLEKKLPPSDLIIIDDLNSFSFDGQLLPSSIIASIQYTEKLTATFLQSLPIDRDETIIQCLITKPMTNATTDANTFGKFTKLLEDLCSPDTRLKVDLIIILGTGVFIRQSNNSFIFLKDSGMGLKTLCYFVSKRMDKFRSHDIVRYLETNIQL